jgi:hypothetical protein
MISAQEESMSRLVTMGVAMLAGFALGATAANNLRAPRKILLAKSLRI